MKSPRDGHDLVTEQQVRRRERTQLSSQKKQAQGLPRAVRASLSSDPVQPLPVIREDFRVTGPHGLGPGQARMKLQTS